MENNYDLIKQNTQQEEYSPIVMDKTPAAIRALGGKSAEEKYYLVLYNRIDEDSNGFLLCTGRFECYTSIDRLLHTYPIDIHNSAVLVEVPAVNRNGVGEWMMKGLDRAPSIYQFCKSIEAMFPNVDFSIDDYNEETLEDDNQPTTEKTPVTADDLYTRMAKDIAVASDPMADVYREIMKEKENEA